MQDKLAVTVQRYLRHRVSWYLADYYVPVSDSEVLGLLASSCDLLGDLNC